MIFPSTLSMLCMVLSSVPNMLLCVFNVCLCQVIRSLDSLRKMIPTSVEVEMVSQELCQQVCVYFPRLSPDFCCFVADGLSRWESLGLAMLVNDDPFLAVRSHVLQCTFCLHSTSNQ